MKACCTCTCCPISPDVLTTTAVVLFSSLVMVQDVQRLKRTTAAVVETSREIGSTWTTQLHNIEKENIILTMDSRESYNVLILYPYQPW